MSAPSAALTACAYWTHRRASEHVIGYTQRHTGAFRGAQSDRGYHFSETVRKLFVYPAEYSLKFHERAARGARSDERHRDLKGHRRCKIARLQRACELTRE
jgi:hypothetical protein